MLLNDQFELIKGKPSRNRMAMPAMDTLMARDGFVNDFHIQHYGARSYGGIGTIIVESTAISEEGKIRSKDLGIWKDEHIDGLKSLVEIIRSGGAIVGIQLNHAGSKAEMKDVSKIGATTFYKYIPQDNLSLIKDDQIKDIETKFVEAAKRAKEAGFDFVEIHGAHGYLLNQLMHPKLNEVIKSKSMLVRGEAVINIIKRIKKEVGIPAGLRLSLEDHVEGGLFVKDYQPIIKEVESYVSYFNISSGETIGHSDIAKAIRDAGTPLFRIPIAKEVRRITNKPLLVAGNISTRKHVEELISENIDGALIGREIIFNPNLPLNILKAKEIDKDLYHWNNNIWFNPQNYIELKENIGLK